MRYCLRFGLPTGAVLLGTILSCSGPDDSTGLGSGIIEDIYPGRVTIDRHFREYSMDGTSCDSGFSLPGPSDVGFGIHAVRDSGLIVVIGAQGGEQAAAYIRFIPFPDSGNPRRFQAADSMDSVVVRFFCDTATAGRTVEAWLTADSLHALNPSAGLGDHMLGTLSFTKDPADSTSSTVADSLVIKRAALMNAPLMDSIFAACTTATTDTTALKQRRVIGFILRRPNVADPLVRFYGNPSVSVHFRKGTADTFFTYTPRTGSIAGNSLSFLYYLADDGRPDSLQRIPVLSYAAKRTAVFRYAMDSLWATIAAMNNQAQAQVVSAVFRMRRLDTIGGDTLKVRYLMLAAPFERNGFSLDSAFAAAPSNQSAIALPDTLPVNANVYTTLENFNRMDPRPPVLFMYIRFAEDVKQTWKQSGVLGAPLLSAVFAVP